MSIYRRKMTDEEFKEYKIVLLDEHKKFGEYLEKLDQSIWKLLLDINNRKSIEKEKTVMTYTDHYDNWWNEEFEEEYGKLD